MVRTTNKMVVFGAAAYGAYALLGQQNFAMPSTRGGAAPERSLRGASSAQAASNYVAFEPSKTVAEESPVEAVGSFARAALAVVAALAVAFVPMDDAQAARSGGRMGGGGGMGRRAAPPPRAAAPRTSTSSTTNFNVGVGIAPPIYSSPFGFGGGFGFGMPFFPPMFGPTIAIGGGSSATDQMLQNQQRQDERVIDQQKSEIDKMQKEIAELKAAKAAQK